MTIDLTVTTVDPTVTVANGIYTANGTGTYQWIDCSTGSAISGETGQSFTPTANGDYAVVITNGSCTDTSACTAIFNIGINEIPNTLVLSAYPNPTTGQVVISMKEMQNELTVNVLNITGKIVSTNHYEQTKSLEMNIDGADGVYFIHVISENSEHQVIKVIKKN